MAHTLAVITLYVGLSCLAGVRAHCIQTTVSGLREYRLKGIHGRFLADRNVLSTVLERFEQSNFPDGEVELTIPRNLPGPTYDEDLFGEFIVSYASIEEEYFDGDLNKTVRDDYQFSLLALPIQSGATHGVIILAEITDSDFPFMAPMAASGEIRVQVDSLEVTWDPEQRVTYRSGDDVFSLHVQYDDICDGENQVGKDFLGVVGNPVLRMPQQGNLDWGCDGRNNSFCDYLTKHRQSLDEVGSNVCVSQVVIDSMGCSAKMEILEMTGVFRDMAPYMAETAPAPSISSELFFRNDSAAIVYPCLC